MSTYLTAGRRAFGETEVNIIEGSESFAEAAKEAAKIILSEQHEDFNDNIYIDVVTDGELKYEKDFIFEAEDLR